MVDNINNLIFTIMGHQFKEIDTQIIRTFADMLNEQAETKKHKDFKETLLAMFHSKNELTANMKRNKSLMNNPDVFYFQVAKAFFLSKVNLSETKNEGIARFIYNSLVLTGIHSCPDVCYPKVVRLLNELYPKK